MKTTGLCHSRCYILLYDVYSPLLVPVGVVGGPSPLLLPGGGVADPHDLHPCVPAPQGAAINGHKIASKMALPSTRAARHADGYSVTAAPCTSGAMAGIPSQLHHALPEQWRGFRHSYTMNFRSNGGDSVTAAPCTSGAMAGIPSQLHHALSEQWWGFRQSCTMHFRNGGDFFTITSLLSQKQHFSHHNNEAPSMKTFVTMTGACFRHYDRRISGSLMLLPPK